MKMTPQSIRNVPYDNVFSLLLEPVFYVEGKKYQILNEHELRNVRLANTAGVEIEDLVEDVAVVGRTVEQLVNITAAGSDFRLVDRTDAKLIFTIIDHFFQAQRINVSESMTGLTDTMKKDFTDLTNLANKMLELIAINDRLDLMNAPVEAKVPYKGIFAPTFEMLRKPKGQPEQPPTPTYRSPFANLLPSKKTNFNRWTN